MWPADRLFDKMKNLVEQPLQKAPGVQNFVSMETVRVIICQTFEKELLHGRSAFIIKVSLLVITWLSRARLSPEVTARVARMMRTREEPEVVLELFLRVAFVQAPPNRKPGWTSILLLESVQGAWPLYQQSPNLGRGSFLTLYICAQHWRWCQRKRGLWILIPQAFISDEIMMRRTPRVWIF